MEKCKKQETKLYIQIYLKNMNRETVIMYAAFFICVIQVVGDQFFSFELNITAFLSFLAVGGGANAITVINAIIEKYNLFKGKSK